MRELERGSQPSSLPSRAPDRVAIVGAGRLGTALSAALRAGTAGTAGLAGPGAGLAGLARPVEVEGPLGRGQTPTAPVVLLCVPDAAIADAAAAIGAGQLVGHCSGATALDVLGGRPRFSLHPLMTITEAGARFAGAGAAVDGSDPDALAVAVGLAELLGMRPIRVAPADRVAYHAASAIASNFLITLQAAAERLATTAGISRADLVPLVRATVENWAALGPERALTGPVARGDEATVAAQRAAVEQRAPELVELFDSLVAATSRLAGRSVAGAAA